MKYTCPQCGKSIDISTDALIASEYFIVCPQCLTKLQIVGDYAYVPLEDGSLDLQPDEPKPVETVEVLPPPITAEQPLPQAQPQPVGFDPLFGDAVRFLGECTAITPMMLRDRFNITLERAQALLMQLEQAGIVGPYNGGGPRQILIPHNMGVPNPYIVGTPVPNQAGQDQAPTNTPDNKTYTFTCSSCLSLFLVATLVLIFIRACSG
ncbi:MAG: hypothetical protein J5565_04160 [Muribaculaceae bacterium]|nr:hypothetical protein [Muribaculaceae bacterium]